MFIHVLPGDSLTDSFRLTGIEGEVVICRECFVDGDAKARDLAELWMKRSEFLSSSYGGSAEDYQEKTVVEFERLARMAPGNESVLWFEYELFCQVNLWFTVWFLRDSDSAISVAYPPFEEEPELFKGFGYVKPPQLEACFESRIALNEQDIALAIDLWEAFRARNFIKLDQLASHTTDAFPTLKTVVDAACSIESGPRKTVMSIVEEGKTSFGEVFQEFNARAPVYGFGDLQVKRIYEDVIRG